MTQSSFWTPDPRTPMGRCSCGATVYSDSFRDRLSYEESRIAGGAYCQRCQDRDTFALAADGTVRYPIRRGVIAAPELCNGAVCELGLLPFRFLAPDPHRIAFEARYTLRAGPHLSSVDVWDAFEPMCDVLVDHQVRLTEVADVGDPRVRDAFHVDLVVVLDRPAADALQCMPFEVSAPRAVLSEVIHWSVFHSSALLAPWLADSVPASALPTCALAGVALDPGALVPPLRYIVSEHRELFPELSWESAT